MIHDTLQYVNEAHIVHITYDVICTMCVSYCVQVRAGCDFMCRVCQDEYQLYFHFFSIDSPELK